MDLLMNWLGQASFIESIYYGNLSAAKKLSNLWNSNGYPTIVLKGFSIA